MKKVTMKISPKYYEAVLSNDKQFELRKDEDGLEVGDILILKEWDGEKFTGHFVNVPVRYIMRGEEAERCGVQKGWCVIGL